MTTESRVCRMFPLGSVLVPFAPLPLHIFEPRYQQLLNESLEDDGTFGVVLITHGGEVGGGDTRVGRGTLATIEGYSRLDDGRAAVIARGVSRIEVVEWLADDPYPKARVRDLVEPAVTSSDQDSLDQARAALSGVLAAAKRAGMGEASLDFEWSTDVAQAAWEIIALAPIGALDRQRMLDVDDRSERMDALTELLVDRRSDLDLIAEIDGSN